MTPQIQHGDIEAISRNECGWLVDLASTVESGSIQGAQGQFFTPIVTDGLCGARDLSAYRVTLTAERHVTPHCHAEDRLVLIRSGHAVTLMASPEGTRWETILVTGPGDLVFLPARYPHQAIGLGGETVHAVEISGDARFNESVILLPGMNDVALTEQVRRDFSEGRLRLGSHPAATLSPRSVPTQRHRR
ncbi:hypothetical protein ACWCXB_24245 [Streptomyces sp. NPDC001514]